MKQPADRAVASRADDQKVQLLPGLNQLLSRAPVGHDPLDALHLRQASAWRPTSASIALGQSAGIGVLAHLFQGHNPESLYRACVRGRELACRGKGGFALR